MTLPVEELTQGLYQARRDRVGTALTEARPT